MFCGLVCGVYWGLDFGTVVWYARVVSGTRVGVLYRTWFLGALSLLICRPIVVVRLGCILIVDERVRVGQRKKRGFPRAGTVRVERKVSSWRKSLAVDAAN